MLDFYKSVIKSVLPFSFTRVGLQSSTAARCPAQTALISTGSKTQLIKHVDDYFVEFVST